MVDVSEHAFGVLGRLSSEVEPAMAVVREKKRQGVADRQRLCEGSKRSSKLDTADKLAQMRAKKFKTVDICFVFDITASMGAYLAAAAARVSEIGSSMNKLLGEGASVRVAFVGYRDYGDRKPQVQPFTADLAEVGRFVKGLSAEGGGDVCEDVLSGLEEAVKLGWSAKTRVMFLLSQSPPHGRRFRSSQRVQVCSDLEAIRRAAANASVPAEKRAGLQKWMETQVHDLYDEDERQWGPMDQALQAIRSHDVQLFCLRVDENSDMDAMYAVFRNMYDDCASKRFLRVIPVTADPDVFCKAVTFSTSESISMSVSRLQSCSASMAQYDKTLLPVVVMPTEPDWETRTGWRSVTGDLVSYEFIGFDRKPKQIPRHDCKLSFRMSPFSQGGMRYAFYLYDEEYKSKLVGKVYQHRDAERQSQHTYEGDMRTQAYARHLAHIFSEKCPEHPLQFVPAQLLILHDAPSLPCQYMAVEQWISGRYEKKTSNLDYASDNSDCAQAFSHWTYQFTGGHYMVTDIQGVGSTLTDPQIHSHIDMFGRGNLGEEGMDSFFRAHVCNDICRILELKSHPAQLGGQLPVVEAVPPPQEQGAAGLTPMKAFMQALQAGATSALAAGTSSAGPALEQLAGATIKWEHPPAVVAVAPNSPASEVMLEPGCCLVRIGGASVTAMPRVAVLRLLAADDTSLSFEWSPEELKDMVEAHCGLRVRRKVRAQIQRDVDAVCQIVLRSHEDSPDADKHIATVQKAQEGLTAQVENLADEAKIADIVAAMRDMWKCAEEGKQEQVREAIEQHFNHRCGEAGMMMLLHLEMFAKFVSALRSLCAVGGLQMAVLDQLQKDIDSSTEDVGEARPADVEAEPTVVMTSLQDASGRVRAGETAPRRDEPAQGVPQGSGPSSRLAVERRVQRSKTPARRRSLAPTVERQAALRRAISGLHPERRKENMVCEGKCGGWVEVDKLEYQAEGQVVLCEACNAKVLETTEEVPCTVPGCRGVAAVSRFLLDLDPSIAPPSCTDCGAALNDPWILLPHGAPSNQRG